MSGFLLSAVFISSLTYWQSAGVEDQSYTADSVEFGKFFSLIQFIVFSKRAWFFSYQLLFDTYHISPVPIHSFSSSDKLGWASNQGEWEGIYVLYVYVYYSLLQEVHSVLVLLQLPFIILSLIHLTTFVGKQKKSEIS